MLQYPLTPTCQIVEVLGTFISEGMPMPKRVFISHAEEDRQAAEAIRGALEARSIDCWIAPRDIDPAVNYAKAIMQGIASAELMILFFSEFADKSPHVLSEVR